MSRIFSISKQNSYAEALVKIQKFVEDDEENKKILAQIVPFVEQNIAKHFSENAPNFDLLEHYLEHLSVQHRMNHENVRFLLQSFLFCLNHTEYWDSIIKFLAWGYFSEMNTLIDEIVSKKKDLSQVPEHVKLWYQCMTSKDLPIIPNDFILDRCTYSLTNVFDLLSNDFVDSYRTTSTSFITGQCFVTGKITRKSNAKIYMIIKTHNMPGLVLFFGTYNTLSGEVVLPPGLRYTFNKTDTLNRVDARVREIASEQHTYYIYQPLEVSHSFDGTQYIPKDKSHGLFYRAYDVTFIPNLDEKQFFNPTIVKRVHDLKILSEKLDKIILKHRAQKRIQDVAIRFRSNLIAKAELKKKLETERLFEKKASKYQGKLKNHIQEALNEEKNEIPNASKKERQKTNKKFMKAELTYQIALQSKISPALKDIQDLIGQFKLSSRAQKYAVGLANHPKHCTLIRQAFKTGNWRYLGSVDDNIKKLLHKKSHQEFPDKCL